MRRAATEKRLTTSEWRKHYNQHVWFNEFATAKRIGKSVYEVDCVCDKQHGRFRKNHALGCPTGRYCPCKCEKYPVRNNGKEKQKVQREMREAV